MFERFTQEAVQVIVHAQNEARRLGHNFVGTETMLLGMISEGSGAAAKTLAALKINLDKARIEVEKHVGKGKGIVEVEIPFTPSAKRALELAWDEAQKANSHQINTGHLLRGLCREAGGVGTKALKEMGVLPETVAEKALVTMAEVNEHPQDHSGYRPGP